MVAFVPGSNLNKRYIILNATGGISGTFNALVNGNLPSGFRANLSSDATHAFLNLTLNFTGPSDPSNPSNPSGPSDPSGPSTPTVGGGLNGNQQNVANALTNFFNSTGGIPLVFTTLTPAGLTQASGEVATGSQQTTFDAMNLFMGLLTDPFIAGRGDGLSVGGGATPFAEESDGAFLRGQRQAAFEERARRLCRDLPPRRRRPWSMRSPSAGACGRRAMAARRPPTAMRCWDPTPRPAGIRGRRGRRRLPPLAVHACRLRAGRWRHQFFRRQRAGQRTLRPVPGRRVPASHRRAGLYFGGAGLRLAGHHHRPHRHHRRRRSAAGKVQRQRLLRPRRRRLSLPDIPWMGVFTPYAAAQFTTFDLPAYAERALVRRHTFALAYGAKDVTADAQRARHSHR